MVRSKTLRGLLNQRVSIYTAGQANEYGEGLARAEVLSNVACRFVEGGLVQFSKVAGGVVELGNAQLWLDGDAPVVVGHVVCAPNRREYRVIKVAKPVDIGGKRPDHTKCILE